MGRDITILGLESSCDDTAAAVVRGRGILSSVVADQTALHAAYGGVVPEIAARAHAEKLDICIEQALTEAKVALSDIDAIAVTAGPGLIGGVLSGVMMAKGLSAATGKPLIGVNHLAGHALTPRLTDGIEYPYLILLVSGGHCQFLRVDGPTSFVRLGSTIDDAPGEAFEITIPVNAVAHRSSPGSRLRLALSTSYWPMIWPAPEAATITLQESSSSLSLPLRPTDGTDAPYEPFAAAEAAPPLQKDVLRPATNTRTITTDAETGRQSISILDDFGSDRIVEIDLTTDHVARETYSIQPGDPLSARMETHWSQGLSRGDWNVSTETYCTLTGDATHFHVTGRIEAYESGKLIFDKDFEESIPRNML